MNVWLHNVLYVGGNKIFHHFFWGSHRNIPVSVFKLFPTIRNNLLSHTQKNFREMFFRSSNEVLGSVTMSNFIEITYVNFCCFFSVNWKRSLHIHSILATSLICINDKIFIKFLYCFWNKILKLIFLIFSIERFNGQFFDFD